MLYELLPNLNLPGFTLFQFLTSRSGAALFTALIICFITGKPIISWLSSKQPEGQPIRDDGPEQHFKKKGTPTMGGAMILLAITFSTLLWADLSEDLVWAALLATLGFGIIGFFDDFSKLRRRNANGIGSRHKLILQFIISLLVVIYIALNTRDEIAFTLDFPLIKTLALDLGLFYLALGIFVLIGTSNAVNLTDGLDGLAIVPIMIAAASFGFIAYITGRADFSDYLQLIHIPGAGELSVVLASAIGAGMGFLWFNAPPAKVFMGDTGSLSMGALIGTVAIIIKHELVLVIIGGLFVLEALSVIIQVTSFKMTGKRVFRMAPIHHHYEKKGWSESTIVIRFWIISAILALIGLATLKIN